MGPIRSGNLILIGSLRADVAAADTASPNTTNPTAPLRPHGRWRSRDAWIAVDNDAADAGVSVVVTIYGSVTPLATDATRAAASSWRVLGQLNNGGAITPTTNAALSTTNRLAYAEAMPGVLAYPYLWATITGTLGQATDVEVYGESA